MVGPGCTRVRFRSLAVVDGWSGCVVTACVSSITYVRHVQQARSDFIPLVVTESVALVSENRGLYNQ